MQFIQSIFLSSRALTAALPAAALSLEVTPGSLHDLLTDEVKQTSSLTLTGSIDKRDFDVLSDELPALRELDLSAVTIAGYEPYALSGMMKAQFEAGALPPGALLGKGLTALLLPANLKSIEQAALAGNDFVSISIPESVTSIGADAFYGCKKLTAILIPASVSSFGERTFSNCDALAKAQIETSELPAGTFTGCTSLTEVTLPATLTTIGADAFAGCTSLTSITIPSGLKSVGEKAFVASGLESISLPGSVSAVGDYAFALCPQLASAKFSGHPEMGDGIFFYDPALTEVNFVTNRSGAPIEFPDYLFAGTSGLTLPDGLNNVLSLGRYALKDNAARELNLGSILAYLGDGALEGMTTLETIHADELGTNVPELGKDVFAGIDQANVALITAHDQPTDAWENADQWKEFDISPATGIYTPDAPQADVRAWFAGSDLHVRAGVEIEQVQVCDPAGAVLATLSPADFEATIDMTGFSARIYIVIVHTQGGTSTFKLTR